MKKSKLVVSAIATALAVAMLVGCAAPATAPATPDADKNAVPQEQAKQPEQAPAADGVVEIRLSNWRVEEIEAFKSINEEFMKEFPNIRPVYDAIKATEYDSKLAIDLSAGTAADLMYIRPFDRGYDLYKNGYLDPVTKEQIPNLANITQLQTDIYTEATSGTMYAAPYVYINYGFMYNKTMFDELGIAVPETWDDFFAACDKIKAAGKLPLAFGIKEPWILSGSVSDSIFGAFVGGEEGRQKLLKGELLPTSPEMVAQFETMNRFVPYMPPNFEGVSYLDNVQLFAMGEAGIYPGGSFDVGFIQSQGLDFELGVFAPPVVKKGDTRWASLNGGAGLGLNAASKNKEAALTYMNWLLSEKAQIMIGNAAPGLFPCANIDIALLADPIIGEMINFGGKNGELYTISWCMQLNGANPTCTAVADDNISLMLQGKQTPAQTAKIIQDSVASWYAPWQNK